jgi:hypothetical protein
MNPETEVNPAPVVEDIPNLAPASEEPSTPELETNDTDDVDELEKLIGLGAEEGEPELLDVDYEGKQYKLPPELKDALLRHSDYTKKTMDLAETRKAAEAERAQIEQFRNLTGERFKAVQETMLLKAQINQIESIPLDGLTQEQINAYRLDLQDLNSQIAHWDNYGKQVAQQEAQARDQQFAKVREAALNEAGKRIPNFTEARRAELEAFAIAHGSDPSDVQTIADPTVFEILHLADIGKKFMERQQKAQTIKASQGAQPAPQVGGKTSTGTDPANMSPAEMAKFLGY